MLRGGKPSEFAPIPVAELSKYVFAFRVILLFLLCALVRGARLCRLRRGVFGPADGLWLTLDIFLCADPSAQLPKNSASHLRALFRSTQWSLFLFCSVPLFVAAVENKRRGLAVLVVAGMALQRSAAALLTQSTTNIALAVMALRPMWIVVSMVAGAHQHRQRGAQQLV